MAVTSTNALVSIAVNGGPPAPQTPGATFNAPGSSPLLTWSLQSTSLVQRWELTIQDLDNPLLNTILTWNPGQQNAINYQLGPAPRRLNYISTVSDGTSSDAFITGLVIALSSESGFWPYSTPIPGSISNPELAQDIQTAPNANPPDIYIAATDAQVGSNSPSGRVIIMTGLADGTAFNNNPPRFYVAQPTQTTAQAGSLAAKFASARLIFQGNSTNLGVSSIGVGDPNSIGTQLVLESAVNGANSIVSHAQIGMYSLDNNTHGQSYMVTHDVDGAGTLPGAFQFFYDVFSTGTQPDSGITIQRNQDSQGTGGSRYIDIQNNKTFPTAAFVRRWDVSEFPSGGGGTLDQANVIFYDPSGNTSQTKSFIRIPWGDSTVAAQGIISQRNNLNTADVNIIRRSSSVLFFGDQLDANQLRFESNQVCLFENADTTAGTAGWSFQNATNGRCFKVGSESTRPVIFGGVDNGHDGVKQTIYATDASGNGTVVTVGSVILTDNAVTELFCRIVCRDSTNGTDFAIAELKSGYAKLSGTITSPAAAGTPVDVAHTAAAAATAATMSFTVNGGNIDVKITCWTAHTVHFDMFPTESVNLGLV